MQQDIAKDLAIFTQDGLFTEEEVYKAYGLTATEFKELASSSEFQALLDIYKKEYESGSVELFRTRTRLLANAGIRRIHEIINNADAKPADILKAFALLTELADLRPKTDPMQTGMVLNVNFGSLTPQPVIEVIEHE